MIRFMKRYASKLGIYKVLRKLYEYKTSLNLIKIYYAMIKNNYNLPLPKKMTIEPTLRCNLKCKMCYIDFTKLKNIDEITKENIENFLDKNPSIKQVNITGGEPLLRRDFFEILEILKKRGIKALLATNGMLVNENIKSNLKKFKNLIGINISLDGTKEVHNSIRGVPTAFDNATNAIKLLKNDFPITVTCVILKENLPILPELIKTIRSLGIKFIILEYERRYSKEELEESAAKLGYSTKDFALRISNNTKPEYTFEELQEAIKKAEKEAKKQGMTIVYFPYFFKSKMRQCYDRTLRKNEKYTCKNLLEIRVNSKGDIGHCFAFTKKLGNISDNSFNEVWNSEDYKKFRKKLTEENLLPICETCWHMRKL